MSTIITKPTPTMEDVRNVFNGMPEAVKDAIVAGQNRDALHLLVSSLEDEEACLTLLLYIRRLTLSCRDDGFTVAARVGSDLLQEMRSSLFCSVGRGVPFQKAIEELEKVQSRFPGVQQG